MQETRAFRRKLALLDRSVIKTPKHCKLDHFVISRILGKPERQILGSLPLEMYRPVEYEALPFLAGY